MANISLSKRIAELEKVINLKKTALEELKIQQKILDKVKPSLENFIITLKKELLQNQSLQDDLNTLLQKHDLKDLFCKFEKFTINLSNTKQTQPVKKEKLQINKKGENNEQ